MGVSSSRIEDDKALELCRERKKRVKKALNCRCSLATAHIKYIQSLSNTGVALRKFVEPEVLVESSLYTSTTATPDPLALTEKSRSQFSFSSPSVSQNIDATETFSATPSPPVFDQFQVNHMKLRGSFAKKVEEKPSLPVTETVTSSSVQENARTHQSDDRPETSPLETSSLQHGTPPWDYFGLFHPIDHQFSFQEGNGTSSAFENSDDIRQLREEKGIPELEDKEEKSYFHGMEESQDSGDEFDEPATDTLVRSFENLNRVHENAEDNASPKVPAAGSIASENESLNQEKRNSSDLSPLKSKDSLITVPIDIDKTQVKEDCTESKVGPKDFFSSMKDIEHLFLKASEAGTEVPKMLEANKFHFRPIFRGKENSSMKSTFLKSCFSCGEDPSQVKDDPAQTEVKYLTWHRTTSSRSSSSRNLLGINSKDDLEDFAHNLFDKFCMISGSHVSTLDRLHAWEKKLYDEVKASGIVRREYDSKCKVLRQLESNGESSQKIDKTRAVVKDLHSRIRVAIHRIDSISKRIEELRDKELQPQLLELLEGLSRMWEEMFHCHKLQFHIISIAYSNAKISVQSESRRQITVHLELELSSLTLSFTKWVDAQKDYVRAINDWLLKCVILQQKNSKRRRRREPPAFEKGGPPIYTTCGVWLKKLELLPVKEVADSVKGLAADTIRFLPHQEKKDGKSGSHPNITSWKSNNNVDSAANGLGDEALEDCISGFDHFRSSLAHFFGRLSQFAESSVTMYEELKKAIQDATSNYYEQSKPQQ